MVINVIYLPTYTIENSPRDLTNLNPFRVSQVSPLKADGSPSRWVLSPSYGWLMNPTSSLYLPSLSVSNILKPT